MAVPFFYLFVGMVGRSSRSPALLYPSDHGTKIQQKNDKKNIFIFFIIIFIIIFVASKINNKYIYLLGL